ncbi:hypothetical protein O6H91_18G041500 [Diphasiastrum complanatum]|uniref:Uncharacterized protein n=1 Tax=Diphasiastrum complanatum TaxID=34168 RepID=A0ACC2B1K1_DIPCM|nr:hypothetical protein O6H91_18G041500 [Diphasiastrum complanatum]
MEALVGGVACEGRRGGGKRKNVKYLSNGPKRKSSYGLRAGSKGFLVTCDKGQERSTMKEAINLLDEFYERLVEGANATINRLDTGCAGIVFVEMLRDDNVRPLELVKSIIRTVVTSKQSRTRFCLRLLPVEVTCYASQSEVKRAAEPVISHYFSQENGDDGLKFAVVYEARANTSLDRMEIINAVAQLVPKHHSVDLKNPDITIIVQIVKTTCAIGIAHEFKEMAKYNLKQIVLQKAES